MPKALLIFSKAPVVGITKTRLTVQRGGTLTPEQAAALYEACLLDVMATGATALERCRADGQEYDLLVSCSPAEECPLLLKTLNRLPDWARPAHVLCDQGNSFDEHMDDAVQQVLARGYAAVVVIGGDLPMLQPETIQQAFHWLDRLNGPRGALVLAPCQEGGVSLVGLTGETPFSFRGAFYNPAGVTALEALVEKAATADIPLALLETISDVDYPVDLASLIPTLQAMTYAAEFQAGIVVPQHTLNLVAKLGLAARAYPEEAVRGVLESRPE